MNAFITLLNHIPFLSVYPAVVVALAAVVAVALPTFLVVLPLSGFQSYIERKVAAFMQNRLGPMYCGPYGLIQFMADGLKLFLKEDLCPANADAPVFRTAPYIVVLSAMLALAVLPFAKNFVITDLDIGLLYIIAVTSLGIIGLLAAGWSSNNKWSLMGGIRTAAQLISYEVPTGIVILTIAMFSGTLSLSGIVEQQKPMGNLPAFMHWNITNGFLLLGFFIYFIAALAECNRVPFDLPEAESELTAGFHTEYSGLRWGMFFVAQYTNMFIVSAVATAVFWGGYYLPFGNELVEKHQSLIGRAILAAGIGVGAGMAPWVCAIGAWAMSGTPLGFIWKFAKRIPYPIVLSTLLGIFVAGGTFAASFYMPTIPANVYSGAAISSDILFGFYAVPLVHFGVFMAKVLISLYIIMWLRWTLPRLRIDQLMNLCWKRLVPIAMLNFFALCIWILVK